MNPTNSHIILSYLLFTIFPHYYYTSITFYYSLNSSNSIYSHLIQSFQILIPIHSFIISYFSKFYVTLIFVLSSILLNYFSIHLLYSFTDSSISFISINNIDYYLSIFTCYYSSLFKLSIYYSSISCPLPSSLILTLYTCQIFYD